MVRKNPIRIIIAPTKINNFPALLKISIEKNFNMLKIICQILCVSQGPFARFLLFRLNIGGFLILIGAEGICTDLQIYPLLREEQIPMNSSDLILIGAEGI